jgi:hypothetical protein
MTEEEREFEKCANCNKSLRIYFPVSWCHFDGTVPCFPDAEEGTREYNMVATPRITKRRVRKNEKVYALVCWQEATKDEKIIFLFKTEELAEKLKEKYKDNGWKHVNIEEMEIYETINEAEGWTI